MLAEDCSPLAAAAQSTSSGSRDSPGVGVMSRMDILARRLLPASPHTHGRGLPGATALFCRTNPLRYAAQATTEVTACWFRFAITTSIRPSRRSRKRCSARASSGEMKLRNYLRETLREARARAGRGRRAAPASSPASALQREGLLPGKPATTTRPGAPGAPGSGRPGSPPVLTAAAWWRWRWRLRWMRDAILDLGKLIDRGPGGNSGS